MPTAKDVSGKSKKVVKSDKGLYTLDVYNPIDSDSFDEDTDEEKRVQSSSQPSRVKPVSKPVLPSQSKLEPTVLPETGLGKVQKQTQTTSEMERHNLRFDVLRFMYINIPDARFEVTKKFFELDKDIFDTRFQK